MKKIFLMCMLSCFCIIYAQTKILIFGDSNTFGTSAFGTHQQDQIYGNIVAAKLEKLADVQISGLRGRTIGINFPKERFNGIKGLQAMLKKQVPDILVVMLGTNDLLAGVRPKEAIESFEKLLKVAKNAGIKKFVIIAPPILDLDRGDDSEEIRANSVALNIALGNLARKENIPFIDSSDVIGRIGESDQIHMSAVNHSRLANRLYDVLFDVLQN